MIRRTTTGVDARPVQLLTVEAQASFDSGARCEVVHAVETAEQRRLSRPRFADEREGASGADLDTDTVEGHRVAVPMNDVARGERDGRLRGAVRRERASGQSPTPATSRRVAFAGAAGAAAGFAAPGSNGGMPTMPSSSHACSPRSTCCETL